jgi:nucleotide-binding universal stress UspA family protein
MDEIKKILVPLALGKHSQGIFNYAAKLAAPLNAELVVVNVINSRDVEAVASISSMGYEVNGEHYVDGVKQERKQILDQIIKTASFPPEKVRAVFSVGNPIDGILTAVMEESPDMVVMGPKGRTDLEHILVGSVAEKMFRRSPVTIVSYRDKLYAERLKKRIHLK